MGLEIWEQGKGTEEEEEEGEEEEEEEATGHACDCRFQPSHCIITSQH